jgi:hypothetical protein
MIRISQDDLAKSLGLSFRQIFFDEIPKTKRSGKIRTPPLTELALTLHGRRMIDAFLVAFQARLRDHCTELTSHALRAAIL